MMLFSNSFKALKWPVVESYTHQQNTDICSYYYYYDLTNSLVIVVVLIIQNIVLTNELHLSFSAF